MAVMSLGPKEKDIIKSLDSRFFKALSKIILLGMVANGKSHGYEIMKTLQKEHKISRGMIYNELNALAEEGYLQVGWEKNRKNYFLTTKGKALNNSGHEKIRKIMKEIFPNG